MFAGRQCPVGAEEALFGKQGELPPSLVAGACSAPLVPDLGAVDELRATVVPGNRWHQPAVGVSSVSPPTEPAPRSVCCFRVGIAGVLLPWPELRNVAPTTVYSRAHASPDAGGPLCTVNRRARGGTRQEGRPAPAECTEGGQAVRGPSIGRYDVPGDGHRRQIAAVGRCLTHWVASASATTRARTLTEPSCCCVWPA